jgi:hypothetical protein
MQSQNDHPKLWTEIAAIAKVTAYQKFSSLNRPATKLCDVLHYNHFLTFHHLPFSSPTIASFLVANLVSISGNHAKYLVPRLVSVQWIVFGSQIPNPFSVLTPKDKA